MKAVNNRYRLVKRLERGVVSNLYLARDLSKQRRVVLKTIKMAGFREEITGYFRHSFLQASRMAHPNLAKIYDFGEMSRPKKGRTSRFSLDLIEESLAQSVALPTEDEDPSVNPEEEEICFFAIEYLRGRNLLEATRDGFDWELIYDCMAQICQGLDYIHARGMIHYAIKPSNIILTDSSQGVVVKLTDLGIAPPNPITREAYLKAATEFLAPEMFLGAAIDRRVDLYALGVSLYQVIARRLPFEAVDPSSLAAAHLNDAPPPFAESLGVPAALQDLVFRLLAKDPADRFPRASALLEEISKLSGVSYAIQQDQSGGGERLLAGRFVGRKRECQLMAQLPMRRPGCILVEGSAGSGKTHLIRESSGRLRERGRTDFWGFFYNSPALFYRPFAEILWQMGQKLDWKGRLLERFRSDLAIFVPHMLREEEQSVRASVSALSERIRLFENVSRFMLEFSHDCPSVVHIENVHLADGWGLQFLEHLVRAIGEARGDDAPDLTLVLTGRSGVRSRVLEVLRGLALENLIERISLDPLNADDVAQLVASLLGMESAPSKFGRRVWEVGRGNPLYVKEVVRLLVEEGRLFFEDVWKIDSADPERIELVGELKEIFRRRLTKLDERARVALIFLALLERPVNLTGAISLFRWEAHEVVQALHELRGRKILFEDNVQGDLIYHLRHELVRDVVLDMLSSEELDHYRESIFSRIPSLDEMADYPEEVAFFAQRSDCVEVCDASARRARRLGHAARAATEYARADEGLGQDVGRCLASRGSWAQALIDDGEPKEALRVLQGVEGLVQSHTSDTAISCCLKQLWVLVELGQLPEARLLLDRTDALLNSATDPLHIGEAKFVRAGLDWAQRGVDPSESYDGAMATLERAGDRMRRSEVRARLLTHRFFLWGHPRAEVLLARALGERDGAGNKVCLPHMLRALADHDLAYGDYTSALENYQKALEAAEAVEDYREVVDSVLGLGLVFCVMGDADKARHYAQHASELARQWGDDLLSARACFLEGRIELLVGRSEGALRTFEQAVEWLQIARAQRRLCYAAITTLNSTLLWSGHRQRERRWSPVTAEYRGQGYASDTEGCDYLCLGVRHLMAGEVDQALERLQAGLKIARNGLIVESGWKLRYALARARQAAGDLKGAREEIAQAERIIREASERVPANLRKTYLKVWFRQEAIRYREELSGSGEVHPQQDAPGGFQQAGELEQVVQEYREEIEGMQLNQLRELKGNLEKLLEINKKINSELNVEKLLEQIMDHAIELTRAERGVLLLAENGSLVYRMARDYQKRAIADPEAAISRSIAEQVIRDGRALVTTNAQEDQRLDEYQSVNDLQLHSVLCVPLREREVQLGALYIDNRFEKGVFTEGDRRLLEAFADQAAIALSNAWLHEENRKRADELTLSHERIAKLNTQLEAKVENQSAEIVEIREELREKQSELELKYNYQNIIGASDTMQSVFRLLDKVTDSLMPVYVHGESGTGKELVARAIHFNGVRRHNRFAVENCAALTETLLESELFGYVKGAFTGADRDKKGLFEIASGGTIFFDEVGDMSSEMQKKLLRVLQEKEVRRVGGKDLIPVDVRIISASNKDLAMLVEQGVFREDLYYRLNVLRLDLPPLRERKDDIILMVDLFLSELAEVNRQPKRKLTGDVEEVLRGYHWPGNVRELRNVVIGVVSLSDKQVLTGNDFAQKMPRGRSQKVSVMDEQLSIDGYTRYFIETWQKQYNDTELAKLLGVSRKTLWEKRKRFGIAKP